MRYEFRTATGEACCTTNDIKLLCPHCREAARELAEGIPAPNPYLVAPPIEIELDARGVPDGYAAGIRAFRGEKR